MPKKEPLDYIDPRTRLFRCPINNFQPCRQEECMFYMRAKDAKALFRIWRFPRTEAIPADDYHFSCRLLIFSKLLPVMTAAFACMPQPIFGDAPKKADVVDLDARRRLDKLEKLFSELLKKS